MLRYLAHFFSLAFHPLLIVTYMLLIMLMVDPYLFGKNSVQGGMLQVIAAFASTFFIPAFSVLMMRALGLISSFEMEDRMDRIGPMIVAGVFYLAYFYLMYLSPDIPMRFKIFLLGAVIGLFIAFFITLFTKISLHAVGMGGLLGMFVITMLYTRHSSFVLHTGIFGMVEISLNALLITIILLCGIVGTSRLLLNAHQPKDLYGGYLVGFASQFIALTILT